MLNTYGGKKPEDTAIIANCFARYIADIPIGDAIAILSEWNKTQRNFPTPCDIREKWDNIVDSRHKLAQDREDFLGVFEKLTGTDEAKAAYRQLYANLRKYGAHTFIDKATGAEISEESLVLTMRSDVYAMTTPYIQGRLDNSGIGYKVILKPPKGNR